ncbi:MAG: hypothetical protein ACK462_05450 [Planctomyces sp.]
MNARTNGTNPSARLLHAASVMALSTLVLASWAQASPGLDVRSIGNGPITPGNAPAGPAVDPTTQNGQWFLDNNGVADYRTHEFHDNIDGSGGFVPNHLAIRGSLVAFTPGAPGFINGYIMTVSITNNTPAVLGPFASQPNMHGENRIAPTPTYAGTMFGVRFAAHWADDGNPTNIFPSTANVPSTTPAGAPTSPGTSNTTAANYDALAWYSYTNGQAGTVGGSYQVPTWDFGDIAVGQTVTRTLTFQFYNPISNAAIPPITVFQGQDLLIARSDDIKIASYFQDDPVLNGIFDRAVPYPNGGINPATSHYGNSSVFFNVPTPGAAALLGLGGLMGLRRRR